MVYVLDTHALIWYLSDDPQLSKPALDAISEPTATIIIPAIVLAELKFLFHAKRIALSLEHVIAAIAADDRCTIEALDQECILLMPTNLKIFDAMIVATALLAQHRLGADVTIITRDRKITRSHHARTLW